MPHLINVGSRNIIRLYCPTLFILEKGKTKESQYTTTQNKCNFGVQKNQNQNKFRKRYRHIVRKIAFSLVTIDLEITIQGSEPNKVWCHDVGMV